ncbi:MAG: HlyD family efflux transporter periplasmic adaptor subunit [Pseudomonadota bacterium]
MKPEPPESARSGALENLSTVLDLERKARAAERPGDLAFVMVNETGRVLPYRTAIRFDLRGRSARVRAISGVSEVDRTAPFVQWVEKAVAFWTKSTEADPVFSVSPDTLPDRLRGGDPEWFPGGGLIILFRNRDGLAFGGLLLLRAPAWSEQDKVIASVLADAYGHASLTLEPRLVRRRRRLITPARVFAVLLLLAVASLFWPVRLSVVASAEVTAKDASVVAAPFASTIETVAVAPNASVAEGDVLFSLDRTEVEARHEAAKQELGVAEAKYRRALQGAFSDGEERADVAILLEEIRLKETELAYTGTLLGLSSVRAERNGVAVFNDPNNWIGRPVSVGERVMLLADPSRTWLEISVPAADAINLASGAEVLFFTNVNPLEPITASVQQTSFEADIDKDGVASYRIQADFVEATGAPRLGLTGTAKIFGDEVTLFYFLFRRPLSVIRRYLVF